MELNPFYGIVPMPKSHHNPLGCLGTDFKACRNIRNDEGVITSRRESLRQASKKCFGIVQNRACLPVHQRGRPHDLSAKNLTNGLMPETDPENRNALVKELNDLLRDAGIVR